MDSRLQPEFHETIIVGGGMSGIGCAKRLVEASQPFLMITPEVGGRVRKSPDGKVNYGAYYVTADYRWTLPMVDLVERVRITDGWFHTHDQRYRLASTKAVRHLPALCRFGSDLKKFRRHFNRMNEQASDYSRQTLIHSDSYLEQTYQQSAAEYIRARRLEDLFDDFIDPLMWASFFCDPHQVSTFFLLAASLPLIVPMYSFEFNTVKATAGYSDRIRYDNVVSVRRGAELQTVVTASGKEYQCHNLVLATPINYTNTLLGADAQPIRQGIDVSFYHLRGELREKYRGPTRNFFHSREAVVISREVDGSYLYFYQQDRISKYFESYEVITHDHWKPALFFLGRELIHSNPVPHVFIASDHDVPSMENAFLNGRYAANLLLRERNSRWEETDSRDYALAQF